jgi:hypothetical protein
MQAIDRREALKTLGASAGAITALGAGTASASHNHNENDGRLYVRIWPQKDSDWYETKYEIHDVLVNFLDQTAVETWSVVYGSVTLKEEFGITYDGGNCDYDSWWSNFQNAVSDRKGDVHLAVTDQTNFANAESTEAWDQGQSDDGDADYSDGEPGYAFVGTAGGYPHTSEDTKRYKNLAIQEVGHAIINSEYCSASSHPEHALGEVRSDGKSTPMVTFYEENTDGDGTDHNPCYDLGESASDGDCNASYDWDGTHTHEITQCTKDAIRQTLNNDGY